MKRKYPYYLILLILIISSCNTFNNGDLFSSRQGKNKVIERDFEAQVDFEVANQVAETEAYKAYENATETPVETFEGENKTENRVEPSSVVFSSGEHTSDNYDIIADNLDRETTFEEFENIESENSTQIMQNISPRISTKSVPAIMVLVLAAFVLILIIGFIAWFEYAF